MINAALISRNKFFYCNNLQIVLLHRSQHQGTSIYFDQVEVIAGKNNFTSSFKDR